MFALPTPTPLCKMTLFPPDHSLRPRLSATQCRKIASRCEHFLGGYFRPSPYPRPNGLDASQYPCEYIDGVAYFCAGNGPGVPSPTGCASSGTEGCISWPCWMISACASPSSGAEPSGGSGSSGSASAPGSGASSAPNKPSLLHIAAC